MTDAQIVGHSIVYRVIGSVYLNRPNEGRCTALRPGRTIVVQRTGGQLCRGDLFDIVDYPVGRSGVCAFGAFTPYSSVKK